MSEEPLAPDLETSITRDGGSVTVHARGEVDLMTAPRLAETLAAAQGEATQVTLDLRGVGFMDSTGIRVLLEARDRAQGNGGGLVLALQPGGGPERLLELAGVLGLFQTAHASP